MFVNYNGWIYTVVKNRMVLEFDLDWCGNIGSNYSVLFFDMDGTIVNSDVANSLAYQKAISMVIKENQFFKRPFVALNSHRDPQYQYNICRHYLHYQFHILFDNS